MIGFTPLGDRLLVRPDPPASRTGGGLVIPDAYQDKVDRGTVLAMGPGMRMANGNRWPMPPVKIGDRIVYEKDGPQKVTIDGEKLLLMRDDFVHAVEEA